jgi:hypothetical protein
MAPIGRDARRRARAERMAALFGQDADSALDLLELVELAWHDCYGEVAPPDGVVEDMLTCSQGNLSRLVRAARLGVEDFRDLRLAADDLRRSGGDAPERQGT